MCKFSIVIPVYNVEKYVKKCIESTLNQTLQDIEIICINDASTDASLSILQECAKKDQRLKIISYDTNKSASQARKDGVSQAKGEYIMFMDGDDYLELDACEKLYSIISKKKVDILHFGTNIINAGNATEQRINNLEKLLEPYSGILKGKDVFEGCFIQKKFRFSIWNKIFEGEFCKKAFRHVKDGNYPKAQDLYAFFILCYFAKSYYGIEDKYYNYRFGTGITGNTTLTLAQLERYCHSVFVADAIHGFLIQQNDKNYLTVADKLRKDLLNDCVSNWYTAVEENYSNNGFDILAKYWNPEEIVSNLCEKHYFERKQIAEKIYGAESIQCIPNRDIKKIGIFYHRYALGGVQRVISLLIPIYIEMGYKIVLFTDEISEDEYQLPDGVIRVVLPSSLEISQKDFILRAVEFVKYIKEYDIDVMCYHASSSPKLVFDMLLLKMYNIPVVLTVHEVAFQNMLTINTEMSDRPVIFKLANKVTVLSRADEAYWKNLGVNTVYIQNPITEKLVERDLSVVEKNTIVWVGRLDARTKRCLDIVDIMNFVTKDIPDAKLLVVGNEVSAGIFDQMQQKIDKYNLKENIILCGYSTDVTNYYRKAEIYMITSISESFSMTIAESKAFGIPLVMYELPFIEFCRNKIGYLDAPQGNKKKMAENIVKLLKDEKLKMKLQYDAQESLKPFLEFDLKAAWKEVFDELSKEQNVNGIDENINIMLYSLLQHYNYGATINNNEKAIMRRRLDELQKLEHSWSYRIGYIILFIPHQFVWKLRKLKNKLLIKKEKSNNT